ELYRTYVVDRRVISFGDFVRRSTSASADMFKLTGRGYLRPGYFADVLILDRARYRPRATYVDPKQLSEGVRTLIVNGKVEVDGYRMTGVAAGRALLRTPKAYCPA
ncbi:MAG: amidohydrolase, partial [Alphaproteobacteria bacterium]|nr:amidohydrolase [Alphaproteobacteria bacterium]